MEIVVFLPWMRPLVKSCYVCNPIPRLLSPLGSRLLNTQGSLADEDEDAFNQLMTRAKQANGGSDDSAYEIARKFLFLVLVLANAQLAQLGCSAALQLVANLRNKKSLLHADGGMSEDSDPETEATVSEAELEMEATEVDIDAEPDVVMKVYRASVQDEATSSKETNGLGTATLGDIVRGNVWTR